MAENVNEQRATRQGYDNAKGDAGGGGGQGSGKIYGQYSDGADGSGRIVVASEGESASAKSYGDADGFLGGPVDSDLNGSGGEFSPVKGSSSVPAPDALGGGSIPSEPKQTQTLKGK